MSLWRYRHALRTLVERELTVRYKRSVLGFLWSLLNPVLLILTFLVAFKYIMGNDEKNFTARLFTTVLAWRFFNTAVLDGASSVAKKVALVKQVYFPRVILPAASLIANFVDFVLALGVLAVFFTVVRITVNWPYLALAGTALVIQIVFTLGLTLTLASLSVFYSDVQFTAASLFQLWFFLSPVVVSATQAVGTTRFPEIYKTVFFLNPMAPVLIGYSSVLPLNEPWRVMTDPATGVTYPYYTFLVISGGVAVASLVVGLWIFNRLEGAFAKEG